MGIISIGCGFSQLEEFSSCLNIPPMTPTVYQLEHINTGTIIHDTAWEEIEKAGKEEADIEKEDVDEDGIPCITVISELGAKGHIKPIRMHFLELPVL
ncbi:hypothetical protein NQ314_011398 [Rhamnusium bicolor]|uniref:Mutator-like transposase domain-containing protein n=1 Tax=Rhamnusium bicolor TaxID=1586634 RepID=A0AAV8XJG3_9CUCU|nr:hypothetical protein NQ314_011398 [Rhamnusium bicolor]